jgi:hypothetical protein
MADYITETRDFPAHLLKLQENSFFLKPTGESFRSNYNPAPRSAGPRYKLWNCSVTASYLHDTPDHDLRFEWEAFVHSLDGTRVAFRIPDSARLLPKGAAAGLSRSVVGSEIYRVADSVNYSLTDSTRLIAGSGLAQVAEDAARYADTIRIGGLVPDATVFRPGDLIEIGGNLHEVRLQALSNSSGESRVTLNNRLWRPALSGDIVTVESPRGRFVMADNEQGMATRVPLFSSSSISMIEAPYVYPDE